MKVPTFLTVSLCLLLEIAYRSEAKLPDYMVSCSETDPKLSECVLRSARNAIKKFAQGDPEKGIPPLEPLTVKELKVLSGRKGDGLNVKLNDCKLLGCGDLELTKFKIDRNNQKVTVKANGDLKIDSTYQLNGRLLIIPLVGQGKCLVKLNNVKLGYSFDFDYVKGEDGKRYVNMLNDTLKYDIGRAHFQLENLFNGDKVLGETTNRLLNDSWKDIIGELGGPVSKVLKESFRGAIVKFLKSYSFDELFLP